MLIATRCFGNTLIDEVAHNLLLPFVMKIEKIYYNTHNFLFSLSEEQRIILHTFIKWAWMNEQNKFPKIFKGFSNKEDASVQLAVMLQQFEKELRDKY